ncbi:MAG TPA: UDP-2,4-diacetamido-2,4,6-trideoxy-beta-L-altropyranose hydrolase [Stellaceae bacterium]|nr:UDP-2,4-diacetamido-2,4,6-trideoxy-beta-L-altropyranose hydrolase [Stellaceae bacterium]
MNPPFALIRTDAVAATGTGHAMRCLALAEALQEHGCECRFLVTSLPLLIAERLAREGFAIERQPHPIGSAEDAAETARVARRRGADWVVLDGYSFDDAFLETLRAAGLRALMIDDLGALRRYRCELVVNQNLHAEAGLYPDAEARLLLGPRYLMLRREFWGYRDLPRRPADVVERVLVSMGGSDPEDHASRVIAALGGLAGLGIAATVVVGAANPRLEALKALAAARPAKIEIVHGTDDMPGLMRKADLAVAAAGTTAWELAFMGVPMLLGSTVVAEQTLARRLSRHGGCIYLGDFRDCPAPRLGDAILGLVNDPGMRRRIAASAATLVDGLGGERVIAAMRNQRVETEETVDAA